MSGRTPKTKTVAAGWAKGHPFPLTTDVDDRYAEFDRWHAAEIRRAKAEAWEEGYAGGYDFRASHGMEGAVANPYKEVTDEWQSDRK